MKQRIVMQTAPDHWAPMGKVHHPRRCLICQISRIGMRLGIIGAVQDR